VATPGAGKTTYALRIAAELISRGVISRVTVVAPTEHLKTQWADAASRVGIRIDPRFTNAAGRHGAEYDGVAVTYAQVASKPLLHRARTEAAPTLVILTRSTTAATTCRGATRSARPSSRPPVGLL